MVGISISLRAGAVLLLAHDLLDLLQHAQAQRQPGIDAGRRSAGSCRRAASAGARRSAPRPGSPSGSAGSTGSYASGIRSSAGLAGWRADCRQRACGKGKPRRFGWLCTGDARTLQRDIWGRTACSSRSFKLSENKTNVRTEVVAGITTFLTMAYIIFVNPAILADGRHAVRRGVRRDLRGRRHRLLR